MFLPLGEGMGWFFQAKQSTPEPPQRSLISQQTDVMTPRCSDMAALGRFTKVHSFLLVNTLPLPLSLPLLSFTFLLAGRQV